MADRPKRIRTPLKEHLRQIRYQLVPVLVFLLGVYATAQLYSRHVALPSAVGEVQALRVDIVSPVDGILVGSIDLAAGRQSLAWDLFDSVNSGQVICRLDDALLKAEIETIKSEKERLKKEVEAVNAQMKLQYDDRKGNQFNEARRLAVDIERMKLDVATRTIDLKSNRVALERREKKLKLIRELVARDAESQFVLLDTELRYEVTAAEVLEQDKALKEALVLKADAERRLKAYSPGHLEELNVFLAPVRAEIDAEIVTEQKRVDEINVELKKLEIRVPPSVSGKIVAIYRRPGQAVRAGELIMTIASPNSQHILSYVRQNPGLDLTTETRVVLRMRWIPIKIAETRITQIGPQLELIPPQQLRDPTIPEWGLPVQTAIPLDLQKRLKPGELVDMTFLAKQ